MDDQLAVLKIKDEESGIRHLILNRPTALNALNQALLTALHQEILSAKNNEMVKALLISGEGKAFCAGADINQLKTLTAQTGLEFSLQGQAVFKALEELGKPSLAAIHGAVLGGGCELAMSATLRMSASHLKIGQPEVNLGVIPGFGGTQRLARLVGKGRALDLCLTGRSLNAVEAEQWGLVTHVVEPDQLITQGKALLMRVLQMAPLALKSVMTVIHHGYDLSLEEALQLEAAHFAVCCASRDKQVGVDAFLEKRAPVFLGD